MTKRFKKVVTISFKDKVNTTEKIFWGPDNQKSYDCSLLEYLKRGDSVWEPLLEVRMLPVQSMTLDNVWSVASFSEAFLDKIQKEVEEKKAQGFVEITDDFHIVISYKEIPVTDEDFDEVCAEGDDVVLQYFPQTHLIIVRSYEPSGQWVNDKFHYAYPWKRVGRRSYLWVVPLKDRNVDPGRRIQWGNPDYYKTRKEALAALYG